MQQDLTNGTIIKKLLLFSIPLIIGNLLQQLYNVIDTLIVGQYIGSNALASVGASFAFMTFLTSILIGLCMGCSTLFSIYYGKKDDLNLSTSITLSFCFIGILSIILNILVYLCFDQILLFLNIPSDLIHDTKEYLSIIYFGILATFLYNFFAYFLRSIGNSLTPLLFLGIAAVFNIILDLIFTLYFSMGIGGVAIATILSQWFSGIGIMIYTYRKFPMFHIHVPKWNRHVIRKMFQLSIFTCLQQSTMNLGILLVQNLVNSFGTTVMAAFSVAVKIDSFAYMPVQDFGNAFSTFVAQNYGAKKKERLKQGIRYACIMTLLFCLGITTMILLFKEPLMLLFVKASEIQIINIGMEYLQIESMFYFGIGLLFLFYGYYRAIEKPQMSLILTIISLGLRVVLSYCLSPTLGVFGIWISIPIGWMIADITGTIYYFYLRHKNKIFK